MSIDEETLVNEFGKDRVKFMKTNENLPSKLSQIDKSEYKNISAKSALGAELKSLPNVLRASEVGDLVGFFDSKTAKRIKCSPQMIKQEPGINEKWSYVMESAVYPQMPNGGRDSLGNIFMMWGTHHENSGLGTFLHHNPEFSYEDQGFTFVTPQILAKANLVDCITEEPILDLPFDLGATPDGKVTRINKATGKTETFTCEWKCPAAYLPLSNTEFPGISVWFNQNSGPYKQPKHYHIGQIMLQLLACELDESFYGSWSLLKGMTVWKFKKDTKYLSMLLTLLKHVYLKFVTPVVKSWKAPSADNKINVTMDMWKRVPVGYFTNAQLCTDSKIRKLHDEFVAYTIQIVDMEIPSVAKRFAHYEDTFEVTTAILNRRDNHLNMTAPLATTNTTADDVMDIDDDDDGMMIRKGMSISDYTKKLHSDAIMTASEGGKGDKKQLFRNEPMFPNAPPEIPDYAMVGLYAHIHIKEKCQNWKDLGIGWPSKATDINIRINNMEVMMNLIFMRPFAAMVHVLGETQEKHKPIDSHPNVIMWKLANIEKFMVNILRANYVIEEKLKKMNPNLAPEEFEEATRQHTRCMYFEALHRIHPEISMYDIENDYEAMFRQNENHEKAVMEHLERAYKALDDKYHQSLTIVDNTFVHVPDNLLKMPSAYPHMQCLLDVINSNKFDVYQKFFAFAITTTNVLRIINIKECKKH